MAFGGDSSAQSYRRAGSRAGTDSRLGVSSVERAIAQLSERERSAAQRIGDEIAGLQAQKSALEAKIDRMEQRARRLRAESGDGQTIGTPLSGAGFAASRAARTAKLIEIQELEVACAQVSGQLNDFAARLRALITEQTRAAGRAITAERRVEAIQKAQQQTVTRRDQSDADDWSGTCVATARSAAARAVRG